MSFTDYFFPIFSFFELSFINIKTTIFSIQKETVITRVPFQKTKIDIYGISDPLEMCKNNIYA